MLDKIAGRRNNLEEGLDAYGTGLGTGYGRHILDGIGELKQLCGVAQGTEMTCDQLWECATKHCDEMQRVLDAAVR